jgi:hypothetical protein
VGCSAKELDDILRKSLAATTMTSSGKRTDRTKYWSDVVERRFRELGGAELNALLGYSECGRNG